MRKANIFVTHFFIAAKCTRQRAKAKKENGKIVDLANCYDMKCNRWVLRILILCLDNADRVT